MGQTHRCVPIRSFLYHVYIILHTIMVYVYILHILILWGAMDCIEDTWDGDAGREIVEGAAVIMSREHPEIDKIGICTVVNRWRGRLELGRWSPDLDIEKKPGGWM